MKRITAFLLALVLVFSSFTGIEVNAESSKVDEIMSKMTTRDKIGQVIMPDFRYWKQETDEKQLPVTRINDEIKQIIKDYRFGGVILFAQNVVETEQTTRLTNDYQQAAIEAGIPPLLLSIDQEGGKVVRLGTGTSLPGNMALGATRDPKLAYEYGNIAGSELASLGVNVNFAPVMDTNNNPNNPVIGERSISSDPELVAKLGVEIIKGIQDNGVSAAIKHFPGHGDTAVDSHVGLPVVDKSKDEVMKLELLPFMRAADNVDMIMTAHISYPQLEKDKAISKLDGSEINIPATLSDDILTGIVRNEMNFKGVIVTDAMNMKAISDNFGEAESSLMSFKAGADIILMPTVLRSKKDLTKLDAIYKLFETSLKNGELSEEKLNASVKRILTLKEKRGVLDTSKYKTDIEARVANAKKVVGSQEHFDTQRIITQRAITVGKNDKYTLPLRPKKGEKVLMLAAYKNEKPALDYGFDKLQREGVIGENIEYNTVVFDKNTTREQLQEYMKGYKYVIVISEMVRQANLKPNSWVTNVPDMVLDIAKENNQTPVVLSIGKPYDLARYPKAPAIILAYGAKGMDPTEKGTDPTNTFGPNIPFSLDIIFGKVEATGKLPVDIPKLNENYEYTDEIAYNIGYGLSTFLNESDELKSAKQTLATVKDLANNLKNKDLTDDSLENINNAIAKAEEALKSEDIDKVLEATKSLKDAIDGLKFVPTKITEKEIITKEKLTLYASKDLDKISNLETKNIIGKIRKGEELTGIVEGEYLKVGKDSPYYVEIKSLQKYPIIVTGYAKFTQYARDLNEKIVQTIPVNTLVVGRLVGDRVEINFEPNNRVWKVNLSDKKVEKSGYTKFAMWIRDENESKVGILPKGVFVKNELIGSKIYVNYNGKSGYIYAVNLQNTRPKVSTYTSSTQWVRDEKGQKITIIRAGRKVSGEVYNGKIKIKVKDSKGKLVDGYIYEVNTSKNYKKYNGVAKFTQNIRNANNKIVGILPKGVRVEGTVKGNKVEINYKGVKGNVWLVNILER